MNYLILSKISPLRALFILLLANAPLTLAQSSLLEGVKKNPEEAIRMCNQFRRMNKKGLSASSLEAIKEISRKQSLSITDSEILSVYVIGLHCPDVR